MPSTRRIGAVCAAIVGAGLFAATALPSPASAAPSAPGSTATTSSQRGLQPAIICGMRIDNPHLSFSEPGFVKVTARVVCSAPVGSIGMAVALFRNGSLAAPASFFSNAGSNSLPGETLVPCVSGSYTGGATATVFFPPGGVPTSTDLTVVSPTFNIVC